jgi:hypothetical protein
MVAGAGAAVGYWRLRLPTDSQYGPALCHSDGDCAAQFVCKLRKFRDGRMGRACRIRGTGREGEPCRSPAKEIHESCLEALRCNYGFCGRPCEPETPESCPVGTRCRDSGEGPACVPACTTGTCGAPAQCAAVDPDFTVCAIPIGDRCDLHACRPGMVCRAWYRQQRTATLETRCVIPCVASKDCSAGQFCDEGECATPCRLAAADCPSGMFCAAAVSGDASRCWAE